MCNKRRHDRAAGVWGDVTVSPGSCGPTRGSRHPLLVPDSLLTRVRVLPGLLFICTILPSPCLQPSRVVVFFCSSPGLELDLLGLVLFYSITRVSVFIEK